MKKTVFAAFIALSLLQVDAKDNPLLGKWDYVSIISNCEKLEVHKGDGVEFKQTEIHWRWLGEDHVHHYELGKFQNRNTFTAFSLANKVIPLIVGIFRFDGDRLTICDRNAAQGFPTGFSGGEGTLIVLKRAAEYAR